jgi:SNF2 family DNA or RNA helicase
MNRLQEINAEIAMLRKSNDNLVQETKSKDVSQLNQLEKEIKAAFLAKLQEVQDRKNAVQKEIDELTIQKLQNVDKIRNLSEEAARLLALQEEADRLSEAEKTIKDICESFDAYDKAHGFQREDILFIVDAYMAGKNGVLNANDMGLGKTFETAVVDFIICTLFEREYGRKPNVLWLTKKSLVKSNLKEILTWSPDRKCIPVSGGAPEQREMGFQLAMMANAMLMCNYEAVRTTPMIAAADWDFIYIDEVHKLKGGANANGPTAIWTAVKDICRNSRFMVFLSGTPMVNRPQEMWSYLHIFNPEMFPSVKKFEYMYGETKFNYDTGEVKTVINPDKVLKILKGQVIRRTRAEVNLQLPDLTREFLYLDMNDEQATVYAQLRDKFYLWLDKQQEKALTASAIIAQLTRLRQLNTWGGGIKSKVTNAETGEVEVFSLDLQSSVKVDEAFDKCEQLIEAGEQVVVFSAQFNGPLYELNKRLTEAKYRSAVITGQETLNNDTARLEDDFQQKRLDVLCINMATGSEGLNLQKNPERWPGGASYAIFFDLWYSPARNEQAEARIHRQGATDPVTVYILQCNDSVDAFIAGILEEKSALFAKIMEDDAIRPMTEEELLELIMKATSVQGEKIDWKSKLQGMI